MLAMRVQVCVGTGRTGSVLAKGAAGARVLMAGAVVVVVLGEEGGLGWQWHFEDCSSLALLGDRRFRRMVGSFDGRCS